MLHVDDTRDAALQANAHPADWKNPEPAARYNLVVIGGGTAGLVTAAGAAGLGARVALVERHLLGGDCLNYGCVPSKALLRAARAVANVRDAGAFGVLPTAARVHFPTVMERLRRLRSEISRHDSAGRFRDLGVDVFLGEGHFVGADTLEVAGVKLRFAKAVLATGARPAIPSIPGLAEAGYLTNETVFALTELPRRLAVIGGGPIGCELAQAFARFGADVSLIHSHEQLLPKEDPDAAEVVTRALVRDGVRLLVEARVARVERVGEERIVIVEAGGQTHELRVDAILVAAGRQPNVEGLNLDSVGVRYGTRGVEVNDFLQTTNRRIYAAGDVCSRHRFTHMADAQARIVLRNALFLGRSRASGLVVPWCTYTDPELAHVGLSEREARERGIPMQTFIQKFADVDRAVLDGETEGLAKVHMQPGTDRILGATIVASHAGDMISEITLAMVGRLGLKTLARAIHPYPTQAEALKKIGDACYRGQLTPWLKGLFARWLAWRR